MHYARFIFWVVVTGIILSGCSSSNNSNRVLTLYYGLTLEPSGFDPHIHQSSELGIVLRQVYDTLVYRDPRTREFTPGLATSWEVSEDGLVYTFTLRDDVTFHDGTPFNAGSVAANIDRIGNLGTISQRARFMLGPLNAYEVVDPTTIRLILAEPYSPLLDSLSQVYLGIASPASFSQYSNNRYQFHQVGTGPFRFVKYTPGSEIVLERNADYAWGPDFYEPQGQGTPDRIVFRFYTDPPARSLALESGDAHIMGELVPSNARALTANTEIRVMPTAIPGLPLQFMMNINQYPTDNDSFRRALIHATNRNLIVDTVFQGFSPVAWGPLSAESLYYNRNVEGMYGYDLETARQLLASIGLEDTDGNGLLNVGDEDLRIVMIVPPWGLIPQVAQLIRDQWLEVGIDLTIQTVSGVTALRERTSEGEYNLVAFDTAGYDPVILNQFYMSNGTSNFVGVSSSDLDAILMAATRESSTSARRGAYARIQQFIMDQALILPIRDYVNLNAASTKVEGLQFDPYGWFPLLNNVRLVEN